MLRGGGWRNSDIHTNVSNRNGNTPSDVDDDNGFRVARSGVHPSIGRLILEGPGGPIPFVAHGSDPRDVVIDVYAQGFPEFGGAQTKLLFLHSDGGERPFALKSAAFNELFTNRVDVVDPADGIAGFILAAGDTGIAHKTLLYSLTYSYGADCPPGDYTIGADLEDTLVGRGSGQAVPFELVAGSLTITKWPIPGDANGDCRVNILDMLFVRHCLSQDPASGECSMADVNESGGGQYPRYDLRTEPHRG